MNHNYAVNVVLTLLQVLGTIIFIEKMTLILLYGQWNIKINAINDRLGWTHELFILWLRINNRTLQSAQMDSMSKRYLKVIN